MRKLAQPLNHWSPLYSANMLWYRERKAATTETLLPDYVDTTPFPSTSLSLDITGGGGGGGGGGEYQQHTHRNSNRKFREGTSKCAFISAASLIPAGKQRYCLIMSCATFDLHRLYALSFHIKIVCRINSVDFIYIMVVQPDKSRPVYKSDANLIIKLI